VIPEPVGNGDVVLLLISVGMSRVTNKYMKIGYENGKCKTRPHTVQLLCLVATT